MDVTRGQRGLTLVELLVAMTVLLFLLLAVLGAYDQGRTIQTHVDSSLKIQNNVRLALDRVERDLRMIGFGVPAGSQIGASAVWTPAVFYASATGIGFRAEIDGGHAEIICTPSLSNTDCPLTKLRLDSIAYYKGLSCNRPDGASGDLELVAVLGGADWSPVTCSGSSDADSSITVSTLLNGIFTAGASEAATIEQVYYRYVAGSAPTYGTLVRQVRYDNTPSNSFPPSGLASTVVARNLTDFWIEYYDASGTQLTGTTLNATQRAAIRSMAVFMEGYDRVGPAGHPQLIRMRSEVLVRNAG